MRLLLDTQALLWWINDNPKLNQVKRELIADPRNTVLVSAVSFWEIAIKHRIGKMEDTGSGVMSSVRASRIEIVQIEPSHLEQLERFVPLSGHKDPFDHLILAQAIERKAVLVTSDGALRSYGIRCL